MASREERLRSRRERDRLRRQMETAEEREARLARRREYERRHRERRDLDRLKRERESSEDAQESVQCKKRKENKSIHELIQEIRMSGLESLEPIYKKYANMKDDSEGFMITDVEEHYNSDEESENNVQEQPLVPNVVHRVYLKPRSEINCPIDILIDAGQ